MKIDPNAPPRTYRVGAQNQVEIKDCGCIRLEPDEQITFTTEKGAEYDIARKNWGFYATPSLNGRLPSFGLRSALIKNKKTGRFFVLLMETGREAEFDAYLEMEGLLVICWLDDEKTLAQLEGFMTR